jgi:hypothetical protein
MKEMKRLESRKYKIVLTISKTSQTKLVIRLRVVDNSTGRIDQAKDGKGK